MGTCSRGTKCCFHHDPQVHNFVREHFTLSTSCLKVHDNIRLRNEIIRPKSETHRVIQINEEDIAQSVLIHAREAAQQAHAAQREELRRPQGAQQRLLEEEGAQKAHAAQQEELRRVQHAQQEAQRAETAKEEESMTYQHVVLDFTLVTFGAGLAIQNILTGFESCRIRITNLPLDATYNEICALFTQQGMNPGDFHVIGVHETLNDKQEAHVICQEDSKVIAIGLNGVEFRQESLGFEVYQNGSAEGMKAPAGSDSNNLTISWDSPSARFLATYLNTSQVEAKVRELDKKIYAGRRVKVEIDRPPVGRPARFLGNGITIQGLPPNLTDAEVAQFSGSTDVRRLKQTEYDAIRAPGCIRREVGMVTPSQLQSFEIITTDAIDGICAIRASFEFRHQAKKVYEVLHQRKFSFIGYSRLRLCLPDPFQYEINIPVGQYCAQKKGWDSLRESVKDKEGCAMSVTQRGWEYIIRVEGNDKKAVGSVKVRVENLARGEKLEIWHPSLGAAHHGHRFLDYIFWETRAYIRCDWRLREVRAYGEPVNVEAARLMVASEIVRLESLEQTILLERQSVAFFITTGLAVLQEELGKDNVTLDISATHCKIIIKGGEAARHTVRRLIDESLHHLDTETERTDSNCPICYDEISAPVQLACSHCYCTACIRHFLTTASDIKTFPICCLGDEGNCRVPIPIPTLQRFLPPQQFKHLLETVFIEHIASLPREFKYCTTPDCHQVYRCSGLSTFSPLHCPSCLSDICSSCHEEAHIGMTCAERRLHHDPAEQEHLNNQLAMRSGFKKCPSCAVFIEKTEGCNHMTCKCGAHICWVCMQVFAQDTIYGHLNRTHRGIYGNADAGIQYGMQGVREGEVDYLLQAELLEQAALFREQRRENHRQRQRRARGAGRNNRCIVM
jgi:hypothetical protein